MPKTRILVDLFRAIAADDTSAARVIAIEICRAEEAAGHRAAARAMRGALGRADGNSTTAGQPELTLNTASVLAAGLIRLEPTTNLRNVVLQASLRREIEAVIVEWQKKNLLLERGIAPRSKLLFHGPPGCGKSLTARALGAELGLPVYMLRFDAVIGAFLGQTATHLRQVFRFAESTPCILLLDELDALGKKRGNPLDVGELDRIVISLLQELEHAHPRGIVIGTTNLAKHLDDALWRRFDASYVFNRPSTTDLRSYVTKMAAQLRVRLPARLIARATQQKSYADAERLVLAEVRRQIVTAEET